MVTQPGGCHSEPTAKNLESVVGWHFICQSDGKGVHNKLGGAGFDGTGGLGKEAARQRFRVFLRVESHKSVDCYPTAKAIRLLCVENRQAK